MHSTRAACRGGFPLVEALAAGVILSLAAAVIGQGVMSDYRSLADTRNVQRAARLSDDILTKIDLFGPARMSEQGPPRGSFPPPDDGFQWQADIEPQLEGHLYKVTVTVSWPAGAGRRSVQVGTLFNDPPGSRNPTLQWGKF